MNKYLFAFTFAFLLTALQAQTYNISGTITDPYGTTICDATVSLTQPDGSVATTLTDENGQYQFTGIAGDAQGTYSLEAEKDTNPLNGVSTFDIVLLAKHILGIDPLEPHQMLAADVNGSASNTTLDMVLMRRVILGIDPAFAQASWRMYASLEDWPLPGSTVPPSVTHTFTGLEADKTDLDFFAIKTGDANGSALGVCQ